MIKATFLAVNDLFLCMFHHGGCGSVPEPYERDVHLLLWFFVIVRDGIVVTTAYLEACGCEYSGGKGTRGRACILNYMPSAIITLTTDFGLRDPYVAEMKAVILSINPNVTIVDITHQIEKFNIRMGAYILAAATPHFPKDTIHVAVVDPGVGTKRRAILVQTKGGYFIGPDNGVLMLAARNQGVRHIYSCLLYTSPSPRDS